MIEELRLDDLITLQRGFDITVKEQTAGSIPIISSGGISSYHNEFKVKGPGVVIGRKGTLGKVYFSSENYWPHDTTLWIKDFKGNDPKFIYYLLQVLHFEKFDAGAANPTLNRNHIHSLKLKVPKKEYRSKIASILSSYDELIENNKQRIKLLEEMAEEIYKEWFVRLRFPGFENAKIIEGLPEGWKKKPIDEFSSFSMSKAKLKKFNDTKTYIATADVTDINITGQGEIIDWENKPSRAQLVPELNSVFFARMSNTYKVLVFSETNKELIEELALTSGFLGLKAPNEKFLPYLFWLIKSNSFHNYKDVFANGATQVSLTNEGFHNIKLIEPCITVIEKFGETTLPFLNEIITLNKKIQLLQETRDLLLPRLISGKLSVEHLVEEEKNLMAAEPVSAYGKN
ncbi:restriction endonuclease subunit S [Flavobacterium sp. ZT3R18]|uniref:restriction endonuclease subunit S n=1 Tax=Flavobacterium sp. ZT3R18 TaxID=2594429 RepID=UPI00117B9EEF|nr:restriction endonuclease subunit S [Flavobacterium sp. ZT3R18]TRX33723.1 restriction endonuclease subunit S [Flavobacterium sp. ZT3R18]